MTVTIAPSQRKSLEPYLFDTVQFYSHQVSGVRTLAKMQNFLLADQMGLGKSLQVITVFAIDVKLDRAKTMLVICPVSLRNNWAEEIEKFTRFPVTLLGEKPHPTRTNRTKTLTKEERSAQIREFKASDGPRILVCNYEQVVAHVTELNGFDFLTLDEAHMIKNWKSKRTKACIALKRKRTALLTGTPQLNRVDELWPLLHMIDPRRWPSYSKFVNRYALFGGWNGKQIIGTKNVRELNEVLAQVMIRRLKKDVLTLPEARIIKIPVDLHPIQRDLYEQLEDDLILPGDDGDPQEIANALVKFLRLKQICGSSATVPGYDDFSYKLDRAVEIAVELMDNGEKVVVFTQFRQIQALLVERLRQQGVKYIGELHGDVPPHTRQQVVRDWSNWPTAAPLVCMIQVAGVGLNMIAARSAIFVDKLFVPGLNQQAIDRLHRIGQQESQAVDIYQLIARKTIEQRIEAILAVKTKDAHAVVEESVAFRDLLEKLRNTTP